MSQIEKEAITVYFWNWQKGDRCLFSQIRKRAIGVYFFQLEKGRSQLIVSNWKRGDLTFQLQINRAHFYLWNVGFPIIKLTYKIGDQTLLMRSH